MRWLIPHALLLITLLALRLICLPGTAAEPAASIAGAVRPFVDSNTLADGAGFKRTSGPQIGINALGCSSRTRA